MNDKQPRIYIPKSKAKTVKTSFGDILKLGFHAQSLIEFVQKHANQAGYVNFDVVPRKETDQYGNTHSVILNDWKPESTARQPITQKTLATKSDDDDSSVPF